MRAFLAVDVVLVLAFLVVLLATRPGSDESTTPAAPIASATSSDSEPTPAQDDAETDDPVDDVPVDDDSASADTDDAADAQEARLFASPSGNIVCSISPEAASCSIAELSDEGLVDDDSCDGTVGHVVRVTEEEAERPCDTGRAPGKAPSGTPELDYEESTSAHGYTCTSSRSGVICRHDGTGHGFSIARAGSSLF